MSNELRAQTQNPSILLHSVELIVAKDTVVGKCLQFSMAPVIKSSRMDPFSRGMR